MGVPLGHWIDNGVNAGRGIVDGASDIVENAPDAGAALARAAGRQVENAAGSVADAVDTTVTSAHDNLWNQLPEWVPGTDPGHPRYRQPTPTSTTAPDRTDSAIRREVGQAGNRVDAANAPIINVKPGEHTAAPPAAGPSQADINAWNAAVDRNNRDIAAAGRVFGSLTAEEANRVRLAGSMNQTGAFGQGSGPQAQAMQAANQQFGNLTAAEAAQLRNIAAKPGEHQNLRRTSGGSGQAANNPERGLGSAGLAAPATEVTRVGSFKSLPEEPSDDVSVGASAQAAGRILDRGSSVVGNLDNPHAFQPAAAPAPISPRPVSDSSVATPPNVRKPQPVTKPPVGGGNSAAPMPVDPGASNSSIISRPTPTKPVTKPPVISKPPIVSKPTPDGGGRVIDPGFSITLPAPPTNISRPAPSKPTTTVSKPVAGSASVPNARDLNAAANVFGTNLSAADKATLEAAAARLSSAAKPSMPSKPVGGGSAATSSNGGSLAFYAPPAPKPINNGFESPGGFRKK